MAEKVQVNSSMFFNGKSAIENTLERLRSERDGNCYSCGKPLAERHLCANFSHRSAK